MTLKLTEEQQAIVNHNAGAALVFAVAGSGKTTAIVYRIERLLREGCFTPGQILATSFSRSTIRSIVEGLARWPHCAAVRPVTLHALGLWLIKRAERLALIPPFADGSGDDPDERGRQILWRAIAEARQRQLAWRKELDGLDRQDFLDFIGACKGNLRYADLAAAALPNAVKGIAVQATAPRQLPWYLDLYRLYEVIRRRERVITFDDMLLQGWELLVKHPVLLEEIRTRYRCVLVDEYQDINRAQAEILDLITFPERNYMAIGDDDQTIYEWRGAAPSYLLGFQQRYQAAVFHIQDNFRCDASQIALANRVIKHNTQRADKTLQLTKGFAGSTTLHTPETEAEMARELVAEIVRQREQGYRLRDQVVLIRLYAQTPMIEQQLTAADIPYRVIGSTPFYARPEVQPVVHYLTLLALEMKLARKEELTPEEEQRQQDAWLGIYNTPPRYLSRVFAEETLRIARRDHLPLCRALLQAPPQTASSSVAETQALAALLSSLAQRAEKETAAQITRALLEQTDYRDQLIFSSSLPEIGAAKVATVDAFLHYTVAFPSVPALLAQLEALRHWHEANDYVDDYLALLTIFRAKGCEWPIVFVPHCHEGTIPFRHYECNVEEERRLLYVAITRTKAELHLYACRDAALSSFLQQANCHGTLAAVSGIAGTLARPAAEWNALETVNFAKQTQRAGAATLLHPLVGRRRPAAANRRPDRRQQQYHPAAGGSLRQNDATPGHGMGALCPGRQRRTDRSDVAGSVGNHAQPLGRPPDHARPPIRPRTARAPSHLRPGHCARTAPGA